MALHTTRLQARLRDFRHRTGISQAELARALTVPRSTIWRWETGKALPSYTKLQQLDAFIREKDLT